MKISEMQNKNIDDLNKQEYYITLIISEITQIISDLREFLESKDIYNVYAYKSRNAEFRRLSIEFKFTVPSFILQRIKTEQLYEHFCSLSESRFTAKCDLAIQTYIKPSSSGISIRYDSQIITTFETGYVNHVTCHV